MRNHTGAGLRGLLATAWLAAPACCGALAEPTAIVPSSLPRIGTVDVRFQSYNVEMIEITGGRFWKPYRAEPGAIPAPLPRSGSDTPPGTASNLYQYRAPIDLGNARLRKLAVALAPAYMRVSGTWANSTYFAGRGNTPPAPPAGFNGILTRRQWRGVIGFSQAVNARIVTSFAVSPGARDAAGVWKPDQAGRLLAYTRVNGGRIAAAEFMNEPNLAEMGGALPGYDATAYARDFAIFHAFMKRMTDKTLILGPGTTGESAIASDLLTAAPGVDAVSYHYYGALAERCSGKSTPETALSEAWLSGTDRTRAFYQTLRDKFEPGKPIWLTETADAACGGNPWAVSFLDTFRYLDQLGRLARAGVRVVMHNTLAASDYGLLDERTLQPRPKYWGALLWRQLMGTTVLEAGVPGQSGLQVYAHCLKDTPGGVALLAMNTDRDAPHALTLPTASVRYTLDAANLLDEQARLNGRPLVLSARGELPKITGAPAPAGTVTFAPATISFLAIARAGNETCN